MSDEINIPTEVLQPAETQASEITRERYYEIIQQAYFIATDENFDVGSFIGKGLETLESFDFSRDAEIQQRKELMVLTGEVLGNRLSHIDNLNSIDEYENYKTSLKALNPKQRSYCRAGISSSATSSASVLHAEELHASAHINAQLMSILA